MNTKKLVLNIVAAVGFVAVVVGLFLNVWQLAQSFMGESIVEGTTGLFAGSGFDCGWLGTITEVLMVLVAVLALAYVVLFVLGACKVVSLPKVQKLVALVTVVVAALVVVCGVVFSILATSEVFGTMKEMAEAFGESIPEGYSLTYGPAIGYYLVAAGSVVAGVAGLLASCDKK